MNFRFENQKEIKEKSVNVAYYLFTIRVSFLRSKFKSCEQDINSFMFRYANHCGFSQTHKKHVNKT